MALTDKKDYQAVLQALLTASTTHKALVDKLNKVSTTTEDVKLKQALEHLVTELREETRNLSPRASKSFTPNIREPEVGSLVEYSKRCLASLKPQWQIIAEQHGWKAP